jgi:hypothetical protein
MTMPPGGTPQPMFEPNSFRQDGQHGWVEPKTENDNGSPTRLARMAEQVSSGVAHTLARIFGDTGLDSIQRHNPMLFADIRQSVIEAYREGHHDAFGDGIIEKGNESSRRTGAMVSALLHSAVDGEDRQTTALRALAAHAGVPEDSLIEGGLVPARGEE